jgi:hypothetical protein
MATGTKYEHWIEAVVNKEIDGFGTTDTFNILIHTDAPVAGSDDEVADLTQLSNANGYTTDGIDIQNDATRSGGTVTMTAVDAVWTASSGNLGNSTSGRYFSIADITATGKVLSQSYDYGATFTVADGETMTADFGASIQTYS